MSELWLTPQGALQLEMERYLDTVRVDAPDGGNIECACTEKMVGWFRLALRTFPTALFIGKMEEDTYVQANTTRRLTMPSARSRTTIADLA